MRIDVDQVSGLIDRLHRTAFLIDAVNAFSIHLSWRPSYVIDRPLVQIESSVGSAFHGSEDRNVFGQEMEVRRLGERGADVGSSNVVASNRIRRCE
jgi:hypothetical protein